VNAPARVASRVGLSLLVVTLAACGGQMDHGASGGSMAGMDMGPASTSARATLAPANSVSGSGTVTVAVVRDKVHVDVRARELSPGQAYTVHLHKGSCAAIGDVIKPIGDLKADGSGAGNVHLEYTATSISTPAFVDLHAAGGTEGPALCGDLRTGS
jgi:hypothetical protein